MKEAFHLGGWGMWPTLCIGILLLGVAAVYAVRPEKRFLPLFLSLSVMTIISGSLGFVMGLINSFRILEKVGPDERYLPVIGVGESLYNVAFALVLLMLAAIAAGIGGLRISLKSPSEQPG